MHLWGWEHSGVSYRTRAVLVKGQLCVCVCARVCKWYGQYQQPEQGCGLRSSYAPMSAATGQVGWPRLLMGSMFPIFIYVGLTRGPSHSLWERGAGWGPWSCLCLSECSVCPPDPSVHTRVMSGVCVCCVQRVHWEHWLSLATGWTWSHRAAAASPCSGCWIWCDVSSSSSIVLNQIQTRLYLLYKPDMPSMYHTPTKLLINQNQFDSQYYGLKNH